MATISVTVTPVIMRFDALPGMVDTLLLPLAGGGSLVRGMVAKSSGPTRPAGMTFNSILDTHNLNGDMIYIQNAGIVDGNPAIINGGGMGPGWRSTEVPRSANSILRDAGGTVFLRVIDRPGTGHVAGEAPDYYQSGHPELTPPSTTPQAGLLQRYMYDSPEAGLSLADAAMAGNTTWLRGLTDISVEYTFRTYLVWRYGDYDDDGSTIYTLATRDWHVVFRATGVPGMFDFAGSKVEPIGAFNPNNHEVPTKLLGPDFNDLVKILPA
jgi:hypothetical protein